MSETFNICVQFIFDREGRTYENVSGDPGGGTKFGISKKSYPNLDIENLTEQQASDIYLQDYWMPLLCDNYEKKLALAIFDTGVNQGKGMADQIIEEVSTVTAMTVENFLFKRLRHYVNLIEAKPTLGKFLIDWLLRVVKVYEFKFPAV